MLPTILNEAGKEFEEKSNTSFAKGGFLTTDLGDEFRIDVGLQKSFLHTHLEKAYNAGKLEGLKGVKSEIDERMNLLLNRGKNSRYEQGDYSESAYAEHAQIAAFKYIHSIIDEAITNLEKK